MSYATEDVLQGWLGNLKGLDVEVKKMFGCHCLYCDDQAVGWIHGLYRAQRDQPRLRRYLRNGGKKEVSPQRRGKKTHCSI